MKYILQLFRSLHIILPLCHAIAIASEYKQHYAYLTFNPQQQAYPSNRAFSTPATAHVDTGNRCNNCYPTLEQLAIVMNWMKQLYPDNTKTIAPSQQKTALQQHPTNAAAHIFPIPKTIAMPQQSVASSKYDALHITALENQFFIYQQSPEWDKYTHVIDKRMGALKQINNGNQQSIMQHYTISQKMQRYCDAHAINSGALELCKGDILQQTIHDEFITITKKNATIWYKNKYSKAFKKATEIVADFTDAGIACNNAQETRKALALADACWMLLDCIQATGEGLLEGAYHTVDDIIHPIRTAQIIAESIATCGYYISKVAIEVGGLGWLAIKNIISPARPECHDSGVSKGKTYQKLTNWADAFASIYDAIKEKCSTLKTRDLIKETVSLGIQFYTTPKALHGIGKLFKYAHKHAIKIATISPLAKANALTTPEGIIVRIADSTIEHMKNEQALSVTKPLQVANMSEFFKQPFGQMLLKKSQKTPYRYQNPIYKLTENIPGTVLKKNHFYYLDRLHGDHLEIFDHTFQCIGVYNLDGTFNHIKYNIAKNNGRNIRNLIKGRQ